MIRMIMIAALLSAGACTTVTSEEEGTIELRGGEYRTVTRTFETDSGRTYARTTVYVGAEQASCIPGDVLDCEVAVSDIFNRTRSD